MKRIIKWFAFTLLGLVLMVIVALGVAYYYKAEIVAAVYQELKKSINGDFGIGDVDLSLWNEYPTMSITLRDVFIRGPRYNTLHPDFFSAKKVFVNVELGPLLNRKLVVRSIHIAHGAIVIFRTKSGYTNLNVFKKEPVGDTAKIKEPLLVFFKNVRLEDLGFSYFDSLKDKSIGLHFLDVDANVTQTDTSGEYVLRGPMKFEGLTLNPQKGTYLKDKAAKVYYSLEFRPVSQHLVIRPSSMEFDKSKVYLSGDFLFASPGKFSIEISSPKLDYAEGLSLLTRALEEKLRKIKIEKPVDIVAKLNGQLAPGVDPSVDLDFKFVKSDITAYGIEMDSVTMAGDFSNHEDKSGPNDDRNSVVRLRKFDGIFQDLPTRLTASIHDLTDPVLELESDIKTDLRYFNNLLDTGEYHITAGRLTTHINYTGKLNEYIDSTKTKFTGKISGTVSVQDGAIRYLPRNQQYERVQVQLDFVQDHLVARNISFDMNKSPVSVQGEGFGFLPFFSQPEKKGYVKLKVYSPKFDFASVTSKISKRKSSSGLKAAARKKISGVIDKLYEKLEFSVNLQLDQMLYDRIRGFNLKGNLVLSGNTLEAKDFTMNLADGTFGFSMVVANLHKTINPVSLTATVRNADIRKFLYAFNNFGLKVITYENLEGKISMDGKLWAAVDDNFTLWMPSLSGRASFSVKNGVVKNFEPLQNMSNFLFKKRDFANVHFGEIKSRLRIRATEIDIEKMEIESTVLRLFVEGRYSLKDSTSLELQVPLSNLRKRDKNYKPENVGVDSKVGLSVFLHVHKDKSGKTVIDYDPFKKYVKKGTSKKTKIT